MTAKKPRHLWEVQGRPSLFNSPDDMWKEAVKYFEWVEDNPLEEAIIHQGEVKGQTKKIPRAMSIEGLCNCMGINPQTYYNYQDKPDFFEVTEKIGSIMFQQKFEGASGGLLRENIIARDLGLKDSNETTHRGSVGMTDMTEEQLNNKLQALLDASGIPD